MRALILAAMVALVAGQVSALSCMRPDPLAAFAQAAASDDTYYVLYGTLDFDASKQPQGVQNAPRDPAPIPAFFRGHGLTTAGFTSRFDAPVTLQISCAGPWCGQATPHKAAVIFARVSGDQVLVEVGPCGGRVFPEPTRAVRDALTQCMSGGC